MEKLLSSRGNLEHVPESYIMPTDRRPGKDVPPCKMGPIIDLEGELGYDDSSLAQKIIKASQEFGFFQLINHGIPKKLMDDALQIGTEFFQLPTEDKARFYSEDPTQKYRLYTSLDYANEDVHYWRDNLRHYCHPLHEHIQNWPDKPTQYRDVIGSYSVKVRELSIKLLDLISKGLGLGSGYFSDELSNIQLLAINYYPPCPDPSLTLGLPKHGDLNLITLLLQDEIKGLQVFKDEQWFAIEPIPNALVVNIGHMLQVISNGKLMSADHRVVTNKTVARTTVGSFIHPLENSHIEPEKALIGGEFNSSSPLYKSFEYKDFVLSYIADTHARVSPLERYKLK